MEQEELGKFIRKTVQISCLGDLYISLTVSPPHADLSLMPLATPGEDKMGLEEDHSMICFVKAK